VYVFNSVSLGLVGYLKGSTTPRFLHPGPNRVRPFPRFVSQKKDSDPQSMVLALRYDDHSFRKSFLGNAYYRFLLPDRSLLFSPL